ncbi:MAG: dUTPase [Parvicella sp.]|jgi:dUTPase
MKKKEAVLLVENGQPVKCTKLEYVKIRPKLLKRSEKLIIKGKLATAAIVHEELERLDRKYLSLSEGISNNPLGLSIKSRMNAFNNEVEEALKKEDKGNIILRESQKVEVPNTEIVEMTTLKYRRLYPNAKAPIKFHDGDAGYDVYATSVHDFGDGRLLYGIGLAFDLSEGTRLDVKARGGIHKTGLILANGIGTGDEPYVDEYFVMFYKVISRLPSYKVGDRIAQIFLEKTVQLGFVEVDEIKAKSRGINNNGQGSTGLR